MRSGHLESPSILSAVGHGQVVKNTAPRSRTLSDNMQAAVASATSEGTKSSNSQCGRQLKDAAQTELGDVSIDASGDAWAYFKSVN